MVDKYINFVLWLFMKKSILHHARFVLKREPRTGHEGGRALSVETLLSHHEKGCIASKNSCVNHLFRFFVFRKLSEA